MKIISFLCRSFLYVYLESDSNSSLPSGAVIAIITFAMIFIITLAVITILITYICYVKKKGTFNLNNQLPQQNVLYEEVSLPNVNNDDVELQLNPVYCTSTSYNVNTNHVYELCD